MATLASKKEVPAGKTPVVKRTVAKKEVAVAKKPAAPVRVVAKPMAAPVKAAPKTVPKAPLDGVEKIKKSKLVRDSFTMPEAEYAVLGQVKKACLKAGVEVKKSQLLRIGLVLLNKTDVPNLKKLIASLAPLKAGRPKKEK